MQEQEEQVYRETIRILCRVAVPVGPVGVTFHVRQEDQIALHATADFA